MGLSMNPYVFEKLRELEEERCRIASRRPFPPPAPVAPPAPPPVARVALVLGHAMRRLGESLEAWASRPAPESDATQAG